MPKKTIQSMSQISLKNFTYFVRCHVTLLNKTYKYIKLKKLFFFFKKNKKEKKNLQRQFYHILPFKFPPTLLSTVLLSWRMVGATRLVNLIPKAISFMTARGQFQSTFHQCLLHAPPRARIELVLLTSNFYFLSPCLY